MIEKQLHTTKGIIHYWIDAPKTKKITLVFLPGLTADHQLFDRQIAYFSGKYNILVWDAPGHGKSRPFQLDFSLEENANWLHEILQKEQIDGAVIIGQSMGGYVGQVLAEKYPYDMRGFIAIDSAPLQKQYMKNRELFFLKHTEGIYLIYPWKWLVKHGAMGCATTEYGRNLMENMMKEYHHKYFSKLAGHGFRMLAEAIENDLSYRIPCPAMLICGEKDMAGYTRRYNNLWHQKTDIPLYWIPNAGHNANTDAPELTNDIISGFLRTHYK